MSYTLGLEPNRFTDWFVGWNQPNTNQSTINLFSSINQCFLSQVLYFYAWCFLMKRCLSYICEMLFQRLMACKVIFHYRSRQGLITRWLIDTDALASSNQTFGATLMNVIWSENIQNNFSNQLHSQYAKMSIWVKIFQSTLSTWITLDYRKLLVNASIWCNYFWCMAEHDLIR